MPDRDEAPGELIESMEHLASTLPGGAKQVVALARTLLDRDPYTSGHCNRTCALSLDLGRASALSRAMLAKLALAGQLHDIGKIGIPDRVLLKPGRLEDVELALMRTHPRRGHDRLGKLFGETLTDVPEAVLRHHEGFDGSGYPGQLKGEEIPLLSHHRDRRRLRCTRHRSSLPTFKGA